jgi:hypothetical protein
MVLWVFGYGSLVWKAGFEYDKRIIGYIKGYRRVFHQGAIQTLIFLAQGVNSFRSESQLAQTS